MVQNQDVNDRLTNAIYGNPETLPDQRRQYLGSLRERVLLEITIKDLDNSRVLPLFQQHLTEFDDVAALVNGKVDHDLMGPYLQTLAQTSFPFTLVNKPETPAEPTSIALIIVSRQAVNQKVTNILDLFPTKPLATSMAVDDKTKNSKNKPNFFKKLFK